MKDDVSPGSFVEQYESYIDATEEARAAAERDRDYRNLKQWTDEQKKELNGRPPVVIDYISRKADYFIGIEQEQRTDPKALPRTPKHDDASDVITDVLRYVEEDQRIDELATDCFENLVVEGVSAAIIDVEPKNDEICVAVRQIDWDRFYYDPHSRRRDMSDAAFMGVVVWMDYAKAKRLYKGKKEEIEAAVANDNVLATTHEDKPLWIDKKRKRLKVCQHFYLGDDGEWMTCHFTKGAFLIEPRQSPYADEYGKPVNPIVVNTAYIDRDNNRYGLLRQFVDVQDEINHRRSKALWLLSNRQTFSNRQSGIDEHDARKQLARPDGHIQMQSGQFGVDFGIIPTTDMAEGQLAMFENAKSEILGYATAVDPDSQSGRAMMVADNKAFKEIGRIFASHRRFKTDIYRQCWLRIKQFWTDQKWIRVTDNEQALEWVGLNIPVTAAEQYIMEQTGAPLKDIKNKYAQQLEQVYAEQPEMRQVVETINDVAKMDVDINIEAVPDTLTLQQEQFQLLADLAKVYGPQEVPFDSLVELSGMRNKKQFLDQRRNGQNQAGQVAAQAAQLQQAKTQTDIENKQADTAVKNAQAMKVAAEAQTAQLEGALLQSLPDVTPNVII